MIEMRRVENPALYQSYIEEAGISASRGAEMFAALSWDELLAFALYRPEGELLGVWNSPGSVDLTEGVVRAVLNGMELAGVTLAVCREPALFAVCRKIGFAMGEKEATLALGHFFEVSHCGEQ